MASARVATRELWTIVGLAMLPVAFFSPVWARGLVFISDGQFEAFFAPLSNWSNAWIGGWPAGADTAAYVWYPVRILLFWSRLGFDAFVVSAYVIAALGTYAYLRIVGVSRAAAAFGGMSFALSGFMVAHLGHTSMIHAVAWVPWTFAAVEGCLSRGQRRWAFTAAVAVAMSCLAGHMQVAFYGLFFASVYTASRFPSCWRARHLRAWMLAVGGIALGLLLAAPQLLMTMAYVEQTPRALMAYEDFVAYSLPPAQLVTVIFPLLFGGPARPLGVPYFGAESFNELCIYVPFLSLALAFAGCRFFRRGIAWFWVLLAVAGLCLALGGNLPALAGLVYRAPGFNLFRVPGRHAMEFSLATSVLAAFGMEWAMRQHAAPKLRWLTSGAGILGLLAVVISVPAHRTAAATAEVSRIALPAWSHDPAIHLGIGGILAALVALSALGSSRRRRMAVFGVCAFFGLATYAWFAHWRLSSKERPRETPIERNVSASLREGGGRVLHAQGGWTAPFTAGRMRLFGIPSMNWYGPLIPLRAMTLLQISANGVVKAPTLAFANQVLDVYGVRYVAITDAPSEGHRAKRAALVAPRWRLVAQEGDTTVYENLRALPLAWLCPTWRDVPAEEARRVLQEGGDFDPRQEALVAGLPSGGGAGPVAGTASARWSGAATIAVDVDSPGDAFLVFSVNDVAGWVATVDGVPQRLYNADYALVGLPVTGGHHDVRLGFRVAAWPWATAWGMALVGFAALAWSGRRVTPPPETREAGEQGIPPR